MEGRSEQTGKKPAANANHWRTKYFAQLEEQEQESAAAQETISLFRRGLLSLSVAAEGLDPALDHRLAELRERLHKQDGPGQLAQCMDGVEAGLTEGEEKAIERVKAVHAQLKRWCQELESELTGDSKARLQSLQKELREFSAEHGGAFRLLASLAEFCSMLETVSPQQDPASPAADSGRLGFWRSLFSRGSDATEAPSDSDSSSDDADQPAPARELLIKFAGELLNSIESPYALQIVAEELRQQLQSSDDESLASVLQQSVGILDLARAHEQQELRKFLNQLGVSVDTLKRFLGQTGQHQAKTQKLNQSLDQDLRHRLSSIHTDLTQAQDLPLLKTSLQEQLDSMVAAMDESKTQQSALTQAYERHIKTLSERITAMENESRMLRESMQRQQQAMQIDSLTKINNRGAFNARLDDEIRIWQSTGEPLSICLADVDFFKKVNDNYGHTAGDKALALIAKEMAAQIRKTDFLARFGGEEFVLIMPATPGEAALKVVEKIGGVLRRCKFRHKDDHIRITMSFGVTEMRTGDTVESVLERADQALYSAKDAGRDCARLNTDSTQ